MDLAEKSVLELRNLAKENGIENVSKLKKSELIEELSKINLNENIKTEVVNDDSKSYKLTSEDDKYVEGILELLPDGYGFLRREN